MKTNIFNNFRLTLMAVTVLITCCKCKRKDDNPAPQPVKMGDYYFHLHTNIDTTETGHGDTAVTADGRKLVLGQANMYITNIKLMKADGSGYTISGARLLKTPEQEVYYIGKAPQANYNTVTFDVGVDPVNNAIAPSAATDTIFSRHSDMWFGQVNEGYIFVRFEGTIDSSVNKKGKATYPFSYDIGSNALLKTVTMPNRPFTLSDGYITHITVDYGKLLNGLDIRKENKTATYDNSSLAAKVANNIPSMFSYEE